MQSDAISYSLCLHIRTYSTCSTHVCDSTFLNMQKQNAIPVYFVKAFFDQKSGGFANLALFAYITSQVDSGRTLWAPPRYGCYVVVCNSNIWLSNCRVPWRQCTHSVCSYRNVEVNWLMLSLSHALRSAGSAGSPINRHTVYCSAVCTYIRTHIQYKLHVRKRLPGCDPWFLKQLTPLRPEFNSCSVYRVSLQHHTHTVWGIHTLLAVSAVLLGHHFLPELLWHVNFADIYGTNPIRWSWLALKC